jgi:hypothetical protein
VSTLWGHPSPLRPCLLGLGLLLAACRSQVAPPLAPPLTGTIPISVAETAPVAAPLPITVGPFAAPDGTAVLLVAVGSYGPRLYRGQFAGRLAEFVISADETQQSGQLTLIATAQQARGEATTTLLPGAAVDPVRLLVGARSIMADGQHWSMAVALPQDALGNPVADDTPVHIRALHPGNQLEEQEVAVSHLVAWTRIYSRTRAGRTSLAVEVEGAHGPEATLLEVAGWPASFGLTARPASLPADGRGLVRLQTQVIRDKFGNIVPDGTLITFVVAAADHEQRLIPAYTIGGVAEAPLQAPSEPGVLEVWATSYGLESRRLQVTFTPGPAVGSFPLRVKVSGVEAIILDAGPILGPLGQHIPDGTLVRFSLTDEAGQQHWLTALSQQGRAVVEVRLASLALGRYRIEALVGTGRATAGFTLR